MTLDIVDSSTRDGVDIAQIEHLLAELWQEAAHTEVDGPPLARVRMLNLVVYAEHADITERVEQLAEVLPSRHPGRIIVIYAPADEPGDDLSASISARCVIDPGGRRQLCSEVITLTTPASARPFVANAVASLLLPGLPVTVWWTGRPRPDDEAFEDLTCELADHVIVDSRAGGDDTASVRAMDAWLHDGHRHAVVSDLAWARILPWRQVVAEFFDPPAMRALLPRLSRVELTCTRELMSADALLLTGWLASRLGWTVLECRRESASVHSVCQRSGGVVEIAFIREDAPVSNDGDGDREGRLSAVRLSAGSGDDVYGFRALLQDNDIVQTHVLSPGRPEFDRAAVLLERPDHVLLSELLDPRGPDPIYEASLTLAAALARAAGVLE